MSYSTFAYTHLIYIKLLTYLLTLFHGQWRRYSRAHQVKWPGWKIHRPGLSPGSALPSPAYRKGRQLFLRTKCIWVTWLEDFLTSKWPGSFTALAPPLVTEGQVTGRHHRRSSVRWLHFQLVHLPYACSTSCSQRTVWRHCQVDRLQHHVVYTGLLQLAAL